MTTPTSQPPLITGNLDFTSLTDQVCQVAEASRPPRAWYIAMAVALTLLGVFGTSILYLLFTGVGVWGLDNSSGWGFDITNFVFWIGIGHAGTLISAILFLFRQKWRTSINRFAEAMTIFAVICALSFVGVHVGRIWFAYWLFPIPNEMAMWPNFSSPLLWDLFAVSTYFTVSLLFWYVGMIPDLATFRDRAQTPTGKRWYSLFALGWNGSSRHWHRFEIVYMMLAALATPLVLSVHSVVSFDFAVAQMPGWHATIFPPYFVAGAIFGGFALVVTLAIPARQLFNLKDIITLKHLETMSKVILTTSLIVGYAYAMEFFIAWYSGNQKEVFTFVHRALGPYAFAYWIMVTCNVIAPQFLWSKKVRTNIWAMFTVAMFVNIGMWFERFVIVTTLTSGMVPSTWEYYSPTWIELATLVGGFGLFGTLFLLFCRYLPMVAMAEVKMILPQAAGEHANPPTVEIVSTASRPGDASSRLVSALPSMPMTASDAWSIARTVVEPVEASPTLWQKLSDFLFGWYRNPAPKEITRAGALHSLLIEFNNVDQLKSAAARVRDAGYRVWDTFTPFPVHGIDKAMGVRRSRLPYFVLICGITGLMLGVVGQWWLNSSDPRQPSWLPNYLKGYDFMISGKPLFKLPAYIPVIFELTILFSAVGAVLGLLIANRLPRWVQPLQSSPLMDRVTTDRFVLRVGAEDPRFSEDGTALFLNSLGGSTVHQVRVPPPIPTPAWVGAAGALAASLALLIPAIVFWANVNRPAIARFQTVPDMDNQDRFKAQQANPLFADQRAMRPVVAGTIARGDRLEESHYSDGRVGDQWASEFPAELDVDQHLLRRGQERFNIYCALCHGQDGSGSGIIAKRAREKSEIATGWITPSSLHDQLIRDREPGFHFNTITRGIRSMPGHGDQIPVEDRWAIVAYVKALQLSQNASLQDASPLEQARLKR